MNKTDLSKQIAGRMNIPEVQARIFIATFLEVVADTLEGEQAICLNDFGTLSPWSQSERLGRNPKTGVPIMIRPRKSVKFKPGKGLLSVLNKR